jgi:predicted secreted protein
MAESIYAIEGKTFEVRLAGNPKAGFLWKLSIPRDKADIVRLMKTPPWEPNPTQIGGPIVQIFTFEALKPGSVTLEFTYRRGFGTDRLSEDRYYNVYIEPSAFSGEDTADL